MENADGIMSRIAELEEEIGRLPSGSITKKQINGKIYFYHRWTQDKKRREKYIPEESVENLKALIEKRKSLEKQLKLLKEEIPVESSGLSTEHFTDTEPYVTNILSGERLTAFSSSVRGFRKRECFQKLYDFVYGEPQDKVFILYGLRRTGKTTMVRQIFAEMSLSDLRRTAFIQVTSKNTLADVNRDLKLLAKQGFHYVFLDEVTLMDDFVEGAALFSDVFASCGMKIVLSGTDSLGFLFTEDEQLYDRCIMLHTTFIPYREFESVLGVRGIDEYIRYGGTMSMGGANYNETSTFSSRESADEYVNSAIARNIQHSLRHYQHGGHFRNLKCLYDRGELTSAINRVVEDINHRFTLEVLTRDFKSHDLGISAANLRRDRDNPDDVLDRVDITEVTENLKNLLEIRNKNEQTVALGDIHAAEIKEYLDLLDLTCDIDVLHLPNVGNAGKRTCIAQPGLRYAQAEALIKSLLLDETFSALSLEERSAVTERILDEIKGRMMEDVILLETKAAYAKRQVFVLQFPVGEYDMVVFDPLDGSCRIFEIKHSKEAVPAQYRHLADEEKCSMTRHRFGTIKGKYVIYRGQTKKDGGICYVNVEEYLRNILCILQ